MPVNPTPVDPTPDDPTPIEMVEKQLRRRGIRDQRVLNAMRAGVTTTQRA